jgi:hypothetical protein
VLAAPGVRHIALSCLLAASVACGNYTSDSDGGGTEGTHPESSSAKSTESSSAGGSTEGSNTGASGTESSSAGGSTEGSITGGAQPDDGCDCESRDCRPAPEVADDLCRNGDLVTYTEREGCDYVELSYDFNRGWERYYYDEQGALVGFGLDNAFGGSLYCGVATSCTGDIIQQ